MAFLDQVEQAGVDIATDKWNLLCLGIFEDKELSNQQQQFDKVFSGRISEILAEDDFRGESGQTEFVHPGQGIPVKRLLLVGLGKREKFTIDKARHAGGTAAREAQKRRLAEFAVELFGKTALNESTGEIGQAVAEGLVLGSYQFTEYKTDRKSVV